MRSQYEYYKNAFEGEELPFAFIDLDLFDKNVQDILPRAGQKKIRIASKSMRSVALMRRVLDAHEQYQGIMCYTAPEAVWLSEEGFDDLLVAYPTFQKKHIEAVAQQLQKGKQIYLMVDRVEHLDRINAIGEAMNTRILVCLDMDMSSKFIGIHFGVHRSSVNDLASTQKFVQKLKTCQYVKLVAAMGYEAQIAGLGDNVKGKGMMNMIIKKLKKSSIKEVAKRRAAIVELLTNEIGTMKIINGGGTGSLETTREEDVVTEVTVGSGFYSPTLFDSYTNFKHSPAAGFAIEIVRQPSEHIYTCLGGGYVASGAAGVDKVPQPYLPYGCKLDKNEMAGEVQTPIHYTSSYPIHIGDPIFMRHSKAGELCERFRELLLLQNGSIVGRVSTYRGDGQCFL
ncbi:MAG: amino acid deaminase/aldolase [Aureispira sp.]|nr:amino acid deaminase/aldolase [Aureispira sp.]